MRLNLSSFWRGAGRAFNSKSRAPDVVGMYKQLLSSANPANINFVTDVVDKWAAIQPDKVAIECLHRDTGLREEVTYAELVEESKRIAGSLQQRGFNKGDKMALMSDQYAEWYVGLLALMRSGIVAVPWSPLFTSSDMIYRVKELDITGIMTTPGAQDKVEVVRAECPSFATCVTFGGKTPGWVSYNEMIASDIASTPVELTLQDDFMAFFTSGTTGLSKVLLHNQAYPFAHSVTAETVLDLGRDDVVCNASNPGWGFTVWSLFATWGKGATLFASPTEKKFDPEVMLRQLREEAVTVFCAAPSVLRALTSTPNFSSAEFPTLKKILTVGQQTDENVLEKFEEKGIQVHEVFGQAETPPTIGRRANQSRKAGVIGQALSPFEVTLLNKQYQPVAPGEVGMIAVKLESKYSGIFKGYLNAAEKTEKAFPPGGGYYLTGDLAKCDVAGNFTYVARDDDIMSCRGYTIGPSEVEQPLLSHPLVSNAVVIAVPVGPNTNETEVKAYIVLDELEIERQLRRHFNGETAPHKCPRKFEIVTEKWLNNFTTFSGKTRRRGLRDYEEQKLEEAKPVSLLLQP